MDKIVGILCRHKFVTMITVVIFGLPILLAMTPLMLFLVAMWSYVVMSEAGNCGKRQRRK